MWCLFNVLLLCVIVDSSQLYKVWKKDPLVAYLNGNGEDGLKVEKISNKKWSIMLETLKKTLQINKNTQLPKLDERKYQALQDNKPVLRMCSYKHPCKVKEVEKEKLLNKDECKKQTKENSEDNNNSCDVEKSNQCKEVTKVIKVKECRNDKIGRKKKAKY